MQIYFMFPVKPGQSIPDAWVESIKNAPHKVVEDANQLKEAITGPGDFLQSASNFYHHPFKVFDDTIQFMCVNGWAAFTFAALVSTYAYMLGSKRGAKGIGISMYGYFLVQIIGCVNRSIK